jgi:hypothetical protein
MNGQGAPTAEIGPNSGFWVPTFWRSRAIWLERWRRKMHHTATDRPHQVWGTKSFGPSKGVFAPDRAKSKFRPNFRPLPRIG